MNLYYETQLTAKAWLIKLQKDKRKIILSHYPVMCYNGQYRLNNKGEPKAYMLYGHVHNTYDEMLINNFQNMTRQQKRLVYQASEEKAIPCNMINCFCMFSNYMPLSLDEWIEVDAKRRAALSDILRGAGVDSNDNSGGEELYAEDFGE